RCTHWVERNRARRKLSRIQRNGLIRNRTGRYVFPRDPSFIVAVDRKAPSDYETVTSGQLVQESVIKARIPCKTKVGCRLLVVAAVTRTAKLQHRVGIAVEHARLK